MTDLIVSAPYRRSIATMDSLIVAPKVEPLDLDEVKKQRRFTPTTLDTMFDLWISAARQQFEEATGRQCITATWEYWLEACPTGSVIELPHPPLQSVVGIFYDDDDASPVEQTVDPLTYSVSAPAGPYATRGRVTLASGGSWPTVPERPNGLRIRYTAGYGDAPGAVPELVRASLYYLVGHFHKFGEEVQEATNTLVQLPIGFQLLMQGFKYSALPTLPPVRDSWLA